MKTIALKSNAKINLFLDIVDKRLDGYHNIKTVMQEIKLHDIVKIKENPDTIRITCNNTDVPTDQRNTCYKVATLIKEKYKIQSFVDIEIDKIIPTQAGLAGGSSNAAAVIKGLNALWSLNMSMNEMKEIAVQIGADVPFSLVGGTCLCEGIGEIITPLKPFKWKNIIIIKPDFSISTPIAYKNVTQKQYNLNKNTRIFDFINSEDYYCTCLAISNTLESVVLNLYPQIRTIKLDLIERGAISALMTGSGSCVYGFYDEDKTAKTAYEQLKTIYNNVYVTNTI